MTDKKLQISNIRNICACFFFAAFVFLIYSRVITFDFINFLDDDLYVAENPHLQNGMNLKGIEWSFLADLAYNSRYADYWQPLTFLSRLIDFSLFGKNAGAHHLTNLLLHILNSVLVWIIFKKLTNDVWKSACLAALFSIHPFQVEPVAWITARKDLLSGFFALLSLWAYIKNKKLFLLSVSFFSLSLLSKPNLILFPFLLVAIDFLFSPKKFELKRSLFHKWPFFTVSFAAALLFIFAKSDVVSGIPVNSQLGNISQNYIYYFSKFFYPSNLSIYNIALKSTHFLPEFFICVFLFGSMIWLAFLYRKTHSYFIVGITWFIVTLLPSITRHYADRFMYFPIIGLLFGFIWATDHLIKNGAKIYLFFLIMIIFAAVTYAQINYWKDSETIFSRAAQVDPENDHALNALGTILLAHNQTDAAKKLLLKSVSIRAENINAQNNLGVIALREGKINDARSYFEKALELMPNSAESHHNMGIVLEKSGNEAAALVHYKRAIEIEPDFIIVYNKLGVLAANNKEYDEAKKFFSKSLLIEPNNGCALHNMAILNGEIKGQFKI